MQQNGAPRQGKSLRPNAESIERLTEILRKQGGRLTEERQALLRSVCTIEGHFEAEHIHRALSKQGHKVSLATIYRNLDPLIEAGIIRRVSVTDGEHPRMQFEYILGKEHHDHLVCLGCGKEVEFSYPAIDVLQEAAARENGFSLVTHHLELQGFCADCQTAKPETDSGVRLVDLKPGTTAVIVRLSGGNSLISRMHSFGLFEGRRIRLVRLAPFGGPLLVQDVESGANMMTARKMAAHVLVKELADG